MKKCPKCKELHEKPGIFCSRSCANSRVFSDEACLKKSLALKGVKRIVKFQDKEKQIKKAQETKLLRYTKTPFELLGLTSKRRRVFEEQNYCCNKCLLSTWLGFPITLELEHKDGNNKNNNRENLEALCPNCHSQTDTWKGKNKKKDLIKVSDEVLVQCLNETLNFRQALIKANLTPKGGNYERVKKLSNNPAFNHDKKDIKQEPKIYRKNLVKYKCPVCSVIFVRERHNSHFVIPGKRSMTCSRKCGGIVGNSKTMIERIIVLDEYLE